MAGLCRNIGATVGWISTPVRQGSIYPLLFTLTTNSLFGCPFNKFKNGHYICCQQEPEAFMPANYWAGETDPSTIKKLFIYDFDNDINWATLVKVSDILTEPHPNTPSGGD